MHRKVIARAPTRIDLGGGWTDVPPYCDREGGFVCNVAISRYSTAVVTSEGSQGHAVPADSPLVRAALKRCGIVDTTVSLTNDFPVGAGLGGSSAASAAVLLALAHWRGMDHDPVDIAEEGRRIEVEELGIAGGRQDHYAATHGGALALTFSERVGVRRIRLPASTRAEFVASSTLIYTGESRVSGDTITAVLDAYENRVERVLAALRRMREIAMAMATALEAGDIHALGELLDEHWSHQRQLHPAIPTPRIDEIVARARGAGALGAKAMGASGGGCVLVLARPGKRATVRAAIAGLGDVLDFDVDSAGASILEDA